MAKSWETPDLVPGMGGPGGPVADVAKEGGGYPGTGPQTIDRWIGVDMGCLLEIVDLPVVRDGGRADPMDCDPGVQHDVGFEPGSGEVYGILHHDDGSIVPDISRREETETKETTEG